MFCITIRLYSHYVTYHIDPSMHTMYVVTCMGAMCTFVYIMLPLVAYVTLIKKLQQQQQQYPKARAVIPQTVNC
jgi:hypothetical protein